MKFDTGDLGKDAEALAPRLEEFHRQLAGWSKPEFTINGTQFVVQKFLPREGFRVLEMLRTAIAGRVGQSESSLAGMVGAVLSLPMEDMERIQDTFFQRVWFQQSGGRRQNFGDNIDDGLQDLEAVHLYEITARCLAVNFIGLLDGMLSRIASLLRDSAQPNTET